jgi:hypothetical protein
MQYKYEIKHSDEQEAICDIEIQLIADMKEVTQKIIDRSIDFSDVRELLGRINGKLLYAQSELNNLD